MGKRSERRRAVINLHANSRLHGFSLDAMNTTFTIHIDHPDGERAKDAASACINRIEELEALLSRYRPDSDVSRINALSEGESLLVDEVTHACLLKAVEAMTVTAGLFDPTVGAYTRSGGRTVRRQDGRIEVAPDRPLVTCAAPGREVDLGGIGKGFALDRLVHILESYHVSSALLSAGASTLLAWGPEGWPVDLAGRNAANRIELKGRALSASGTGIQGAHVVHPDEPDKEPAYRFNRVWVLTREAAMADALSTACLLMDDAEIGAFADRHRGEVDIYTEYAGGTDLPRKW